MPSSPGNLTAKQVAQYRQTGFLVLESAIAPSDLDAVRGAASRIVARHDFEQHREIFTTRDNDAGRDAYFMDSAEAVHCFLEEDAVDDEGRLTVDKTRAINKIGHALHDLVAEFGAFARLPVFADTLRSLAIEAPQLWQSMYIFKQPGIGGEVRWHQDASYLIAEPTSVTGFWIAVDDATRANGCLWMQRGGHRSPLRELYEVDATTRCGTLRHIDATPWPARADADALEVQAGSVVVFDGLMPHYSTRNRSEHSRQAITLHVAPATAKWSAANWLQRPTLGAFRL